LRDEFIFFRGFGVIARKFGRSRDFLVLLHQGKRTVENAANFIQLSLNTIIPYSFKISSL
jgi:hypothetical protein